MSPSGATVGCTVPANTTLATWIPLAAGLLSKTKKQSQFDLNNSCVTSVSISLRSLCSMTDALALLRNSQPVGRPNSIWKSRLRWNQNADGAIFLQPFFTEQWFRTSEWCCCCSWERCSSGWVPPRGPRDKSENNHSQGTCMFHPYSFKDGWTASVLK